MEFIKDQTRSKILKKGSDSLQPVRSSEYRVPKDRRTPECSEAAHDAFVSLNAFIVAGNLIVIAAKIHHSTGLSQVKKENNDSLSAGVLNIAYNYSSSTQRHHKDNPNPPPFSLPRSLPGRSDPPNLFASNRF